MNQRNATQQSIALAPIDPNAETEANKTHTAGPMQPSAGPAVSGQQESDFFEASKKKHEIDLLKHNLGALGKLFGSATSAPTNIAGGLVLLSFAFIGVTSFATSNAELAESRRWAFSLITTAAGYLFGAATKGGKD